MKASFRPQGQAGLRRELWSGFAPHYSPENSMGSAPKTPTTARKKRHLESTKIASRPIGSALHLVHRALAKRIELKHLP
jgi:hypothetical protein